MKRIYIAGPMTGYPELNHPAFHAAAAKLRAKGFEVVNPAEINPVDTSLDWAGCMRNDIRELVSCDAIATLDKWWESRGAKLEVCLASDLGIKILPLEYILNTPEESRFPCVDCLMLKGARCVALDQFHDFSCRVPKRIENHG